jgi:uncharacterized protein (TIGR02611 family)
MEKTKRAWKRIPKAIRQSVVLIIGGVVILAGLVMLITPGPGWAALFLGFAIWATEFAFAEKVRDQMIAFLKRLVEHGKNALHKLLHSGWQGKLLLFLLVATTVAVVVAAAYRLL